MRVLAPLVVLGLFLPGLIACGGGTGAGGAGDAQPLRPSLRVMSWNVYYGADLSPAVGAYMAGDPDAIVAAVTAAWAQVEATRFADRAVAIADEIERHEPHVIGLQEAALWRTQTPADTFSAEPTPATDVALDMLQVLLDELARRGLTYEPVHVLETFDAELPGLGAGGELVDLRLTDREVVLVRRGGTAEVEVESTDAGIFQAHLVLPGGLEIPQGWIQLDGALHGVPFRLVSTHLEADYAEIRMLQAEELLLGPAATDRPVVMLGDFNADALVDGEPTYDLLLASGLRDAVGAWSLAAAQEPTSGRDASLDLAGPPLWQRLDLVLVSDPTWDCYRAWRTGVDAQLLPIDLWPSDHAGVVVQLGIGEAVIP